MENKKYLNEETYQRNKSKLIRLSFVVLAIGLIIGGALIIAGINKIVGTSSEDIDIMIATEQAKLLARKSELELNGVKYNSTAKYTDGDEYELKLIVNVLDPSFDHWRFSEYQNNATTKQYSMLKEQKEDINSGFAYAGVVPLFIFGVFIIIVSLIAAGSIYAFAKRREIEAFTTQQTIPVEKEKIEVMTPTYAEAVKDIAKAVAEGVKEGKE